MKWDNLNISEKADYIRRAVRNGVYDMDTIRRVYEEIAAPSNSPHRGASANATDEKPMTLGERARNNRIKNEKLKIKNYLPGNRFDDGGYTLTDVDPTRLQYQTDDDTVYPIYEGKRYDSFGLPNVNVVYDKPYRSANTLGGNVVEEYLNNKKIQAMETIEGMYDNDISKRPVESGMVGNSYLLDYPSQLKYMRTMGYFPATEKGYGLVQKAVANSKNPNMPVYQRYPHQVAREGLDVIGNGMVFEESNRPSTLQLNNGYYYDYNGNPISMEDLMSIINNNLRTEDPFDNKGMNDAGSYPYALYYNPETKESYLDAWDLNDYGNVPVTHAENRVFSPLEKTGLKFLDVIGNPFVQQHGRIIIPELSGYTYKKPEKKAFGGRLNKFDDGGQVVNLVKPANNGGIYTQQGNPIYIDNNGYIHEQNTGNWGSGNIGELVVDKSKMMKKENGDYIYPHFSDSVVKEPELELTSPEFDLLTMGSPKFLRTFKTTEDIGKELLGKGMGKIDDYLDPHFIINNAVRKRAIKSLDYTISVYKDWANRYGIDFTPEDSRVMFNRMNPTLDYAIGKKLNGKTDLVRNLTNDFYPQVYINPYLDDIQGLSTVLHEISHGGRGTNNIKLLNYDLAKAENPSIGNSIIESTLNGNRELNYGDLDLYTRELLERNGTLMRDDMADMLRNAYPTGFLGDPNYVAYRDGKAVAVLPYKNLNPAFNIEEMNSVNTQVRNYVLDKLGLSNASVEEQKAALENIDNGFYVRYDPKTDDVYSIFSDMKNNGINSSYFKRYTKMLDANSTTNFMRGFFEGKKKGLSKDECKQLGHKATLDYIKQQDEALKKAVRYVPMAGAATKMVLGDELQEDNGVKAFGGYLTMRNKRKGR